MTASFYCNFQGVNIKIKHVFHDYKEKRFVFDLVRFLSTLNHFYQSYGFLKIHQFYIICNGNWEKYTYFL